MNRDKSFVLISKDVLSTEYLPLYGNKYWITPNIDDLANKGTVFMRHYTGAPSTAMSFTCMFTGKYTYTIDRKLYEHVNEYSGNTIFDELYFNGFENHILWSNNYMTKALPFSKCFGGNKTKYHCIDINQPVGPHIDKLDNIERNDQKSKHSLELIFNEVDEIIKSKKVFLWIHLPHVILGRTSYGDDIDLFDQIIGFLRLRFGDDSIYITADHGNMNGYRNKWAYGFDVNECSIKIPLITPKISNYSVVNNVTSNTQLYDIMLNDTIPKDDYVISDTAYYMQPNRKIAYISNRYKFIYTKSSKLFELYDLEYDCNERVNLLDKKVWDIDRKRYNRLKEVFFYPYWENIIDECSKFGYIHSHVWKEGSPFFELTNRLAYLIKRVLLYPYSYIRIRLKRNRK